MCNKCHSMYGVEFNKSIDRKRRFVFGIGRIFYWGRARQARVVNDYIDLKTVELNKMYGRPGFCQFQSGRDEV